MLISFSMPNTYWLQLSIKHRILLLGWLMWPHNLQDTSDLRDTMSISLRNVSVCFESAKSEWETETAPVTYQQWSLHVRLRKSFFKYLNKVDIS